MRRNFPPGGPERRSLSMPLELRAGSGGNELRLTGYASVFNNPYPIMGGAESGGWDETVDKKAFDQTLKGKPDLHLLINHAGMPLARTKSGTLKLGTDSTGLTVDASLDRRDPDVQALEVKMERGDIDEMSFAFRTVQDEWHDEDGNPSDRYSGTQRRLLEVNINKGDVSVVNFGANPATSTELSRALRALSSAPTSALAEIRGVDLAGAQKTITRMMAREAALKTTKRALDAEDVNMLTQALGWLTAIDNIVDQVVDGDPAMFTADQLIGMFAAVDGIVDEGQEALAVYLGVPSADPDDADEDDTAARSVIATTDRRLAGARAYNKAHPVRGKSNLSVAEAIALL